MPTLHDSTFRDIGALMHGAVGLAFSDAKKPLIASRLAPRMHRLGLDSFEDYLALIADDGEGEEMQVAIDLLTTNETYFFRETKHYELLEQEILTRPRERWSMWSAACSFGDEAYSIAMLMTELQSARRIGGDWQILGTDISDRVLRSATEAVYPEDRLRELSPERLKRHCLRGEGDSQGLVMMKDTLRQHVKFGQLNLVQPVGELGPFDVVFLRNVLIYFDASTKREVVDRVLGTLRPGGLFFIGTAEGRVSCETPLQTLAPGAFRKLDKA